jgi:hypothetical protein
MRGRRTLMLPIVLLVALAPLAAGCGGSRESATTTTAPDARVAAALALAHCMRSHGLPNWPDPDSGGGFDKSKLLQLGVAPARIRAIQDRSCNITIPSAGRPYTITPADRTDYLKAAACMRSHGFPGFPDPTFHGNRVEANIPPSIDQDASVFKTAAATCTRLIPAGLPYSRSR